MKQCDRCKQIRREDVVASQITWTKAYQEQRKPYVAPLEYWNLCFGCIQVLRNDPRVRSVRFPV